MSTCVRIVIVGGSFGVLTTAYELRRHLTHDQGETTLISNDKQFTFVPSLTWLATGTRGLPQISFDLAGSLASKQVNLAHETMTGVDVEVTTQDDHPYNFPIIATGHRSVNEAIEGLGPFYGPGHSPAVARQTRLRADLPPARQARAANADRARMVTRVPSRSPGTDGDRVLAGPSHPWEGAQFESSDGLCPVKEVLVVCAHPDDESFGLGAVLAAYTDLGTRVRVLCFTHGEASTLGGTSYSLGEVRTEELAAAATVLGIADVTLLSYPDGHLGEVPLEELAYLVDNAVGSAEMLIVFDEDGITGHPDHCCATAAGVMAASRRQLPVLAWALPERVAIQLNAEHGTTFVGRPETALDIVIDVDRDRQRTAIACHASQSGDNPVLWRRLELSGNQEHLRWLSGGAPDWRGARLCL